MNTWQLVRQLKFLLEAEEWPTASKKVFGAVRVTAGVDEDTFMDKLRFPAAIIRPEQATIDPEFGENADLISQTISITMATKVSSDAIGESAMIGGNRADGEQSSAGRGLLEVEEKLLVAVNKLNDLDGVRVAYDLASVTAFDNSKGVYIASRAYQFTALITAQRFYHPCTEFALNVAGGTVNLSWALPATRFDTRRVMLRRESGAVIGDFTPTTGTEVTLSGDLATSEADVPGAGTFTYALFFVYDEFGTSTDERFSETGNVLVASGVT